MADKTKRSWFGRTVLAAVMPVAAQAQTVQPRAHVAGGELQIGLGPLPRVIVLGAIKLRAARPIPPRQIEAVANAHAALLGRVNHEETAQAPMRLTTEEMGRLLL